MAAALLSDIDGTLVDSNALHADAWRRTFEHFGISIGMDEAWRQIGKGGDQLIPVFVPKADIERLEQPLKELRKKLWHDEYFSRVVSFPHARDLLLKVKQTGAKIGLASSSDKEDLKRYMEIVQMEDLVEQSSTSADADKSKPSPDIFAAALEKLKVEAKDAIALGDTPYDAQAATKLGIHVIGVTSGGWKEADLRDAGCAEVYRSPADLLARFAESALAK